VKVKNEKKLIEGEKPGGKCGATAHPARPETAQAAQPIIHPR
jgi:hypothetical protein